MRLTQLKGAGAFRVYQVHNDDDSHVTQVLVWNEGPEILVSTTSGDPCRLTWGKYRSDDDAIVAHFAHTAAEPPASDFEAWKQEQRDLWVAHDFTELFQCTEGITLHGM